MISTFTYTRGCFVRGRGRNVDDRHGVTSFLSARQLNALVAFQLAPHGPDYRHHRTGEDNGDAHLKSLLIHHQVIIPVTAGKLDLGPWQQVFYAEFDGQRRKRVILKVMGLVMSLRTDQKAEGLGLDVTQHGEEAYSTGEGSILVLPDEVAKIAVPVAVPFPATR